ncbi:hypothetical protein CR513_05379, partial [Mucuna pruriens]
MTDITLEKEDDGEICLIAGRRHQSWHLDSGCSHHITGKRSMFQDLRSKLGKWFTLGGNQKCKIVEIGKERYIHFTLPKL